MRENSVWEVMPGYGAFADPKANRLSLHKDSHGILGANQACSPFSAFDVHSLKPFCDGGCAFVRGQNAFSRSHQCPRRFSQCVHNQGKM